MTMMHRLYSVIGEAVTLSGADCYACQVNLCKMSSDTQFMARKELRQNRHMVSLLIDHKVITPKYRGKILVEKMIALAVDGIIRTTCKDMKIESIDKALECGSCSSVYKIPSDASLSGFIVRRIKGRSSRELHKHFHTSRNGASISLWTPSRFHGSVGHEWAVVERYIPNQEKPNAKYAVAQALHLSPGFGDLKSIAYDSKKTKRCDNE